MSEPYDLIGVRYGRLIVTAALPGNNGRRWKCTCDCGCEVTHTTGELNRGNIKSCGCYRSDLGRARWRKRKHNPNLESISPLEIDEILQ